MLGKRLQRSIFGSDNPEIYSAEVYITAQLVFTRKYGMHSCESENDYIVLIVKTVIIPRQQRALYIR